ncbi:WD40 repeat-like protein [Obba rivulosa]|uniref:WD40 repeat-like protein n=1 Tax=Obba rivulosa TaxID=1052685 RepID=A0A8E2AHG6_9APHY|nr:WD40 repeat-like protein [Obba rivulosa]
MPDSFFATNKPRKRKRSAPQERAPSTSRKPNGTRVQKGKQKAAPPAKRRAADEELSDEAHSDDAGGIDELDLRAPDVDPDAYESGEEDETETPAQKRLRLAKLYLDGVKQDLGLAEGEFDAAEIDKEIIATRLKQDVLEHSGKVHLFVADSYDVAHAPTLRAKGGHRFSLTSAVAATDARWLFTAGKDGAIVKWDLRTGKKLHVFHKVRPAQDKGKGRAEDPQGHTDEIWALALSPDGKHLVSGGRDRRVGVWDVEKDEWVRGFGGHRDAISALAFRKVPPSAATPPQLYSGSFDRTIKLFDLAAMGYVETLFGHQAPVLSLDALRAETAVSTGGRDKTVRFWKVPEESQLVFRGGGRSSWVDDLDLPGEGDEDEVEQRRKRKAGDKLEERFVEGSIECVAMLDENTFVSGGDSGSLSLWATQKKKPVFTQALAHGMDESQVETEDVPTVRKPRWITTVGALPYSDLFASGSWDGEIRLWKLDSKLKSFSLIGSVPAPGVVNSLQFITPPTDFTQNAPWAAPPQTDGASAQPAAARRPKVSSVLMVAGVGKEPRLGRWVQKKGEGIMNGALVVALHPRTSGSKLE